MLTNFNIIIHVLAETFSLDLKSGPEKSKIDFIQLVHLIKKKNKFGSMQDRNLVIVKETLKLQTQLLNGQVGIVTFCFF